MAGWAFFRIPKSGKQVRHEMLYVAIGSSRKLGKVGYVALQDRMCIKLEIRRRVPEV